MKALVWYIGASLKVQSKLILSNYAINKNVLSAWPGPDSILGSGTVKNKTPEEVQKLLTNTVIEVTLGTVRVTPRSDQGGVSEKPSAGENA